MAGPLSSLDYSLGHETGRTPKSLLPYKSSLRSIYGFGFGGNAQVKTTGNKGIPGNEAADELAKAAATTTDTPPRTNSFVIAKALIRSTVTDPPSNRPRTAMVHEHFSWKADCIATSNRVDAILLARLRSGYTPIVRVYAHLLDPAADPTCPLCKEEPQTLEHWLQRCQNLDALRQCTISSPSPPLGVITIDPEKVLALAFRVRC